MVSDVFRKLKAREKSATPLAIFISDNGQMWREHGVMANEFGPDGCEKDRFRTRQPPQYTYRHCGLIQKDKPYTESIKVPIRHEVAREPRGEAGKTDDSAGSSGTSTSPRPRSRLRAWARRPPRSTGGHSSIPADRGTRS